MKLNFTGNWFIDLGTLGFVNLMEEVYGWDLEKLQKKIKKNSEAVYYGYFPLAYMFSRSIITGIYKQQKALRSLIQKAKKKRKKIGEKIENTIKLEQEISSPKSIKIKEKIETLKQQIIEFEEVIFELNKHISLLNEYLPKLKANFKDCVEEVLKDYKKFTNQYNECFATDDAEWIYKILPKDNISLLNEKLIKILDKATILKLLRKTEKKNEVKNILSLLPTNRNFTIYPNPNERNFYLYNPKKEDEYTVLLYLIALLHEEIEKIKLLLGMKYDQKSPHSLRKKIYTLLELSKQCGLEPAEILNYIENSINNRDSKKETVESLLKKCKNPKLSKKEIGTFFSIIYENFKSITNRKGQLITYEITPDSTINPFLFSPEEFSNLSYGKPLSIQEIRDSINFNFPTFLPLLSFFHAFKLIGDEMIAFYTNNLEITYGINKKFKLLTEKKGGESLFRIIMWRAIIDELVEMKAKFNLEHLYFIRFTEIENLKLKNVEFLGISKLKSEILIDNTLRNAMNINITMDVKEQNNKLVELRLWLLEEFLKNKPLLPVFYKNLRLYFAGKLNFNSYTNLIYAAAIDSALKDLSHEKRFLFSDEFFNRHKSIVESVKIMAEVYLYIANNIGQLFSMLSFEEKKLFAFRLFSHLIKNRKYRFVNELLKSLNQVNGDVERLIRYLFREILQNDNTWQEYSIPIIVGLIRGGDENG